MSKRYWRIRGYDGFKAIFDMRVGLGRFTEVQIRHLLQALAAKEGLSYREIVGAYAKRGTRISNDLLLVHKDFGQRTYMCGSDRYFTASVVDQEGRIIAHRKI